MRHACCRFSPALLLLLAELVPAQSGGEQGPGQVTEEIGELRRRLQALERRVGQAPEGAPPQGRVDLSDEQVGSITEIASDDHLARPWFETLDVWGFGALSYLNTGDAGTYPEGAFGVHEATLFVEAHPWDGTSLFMEIQVNRLGKDDDKYVRTGEVNAHFRNLWRAENGDHVSLKVGRIDIPFGEEYLWQDAPDNPLITQSAAYPYGFDEGVLVYGKYAGVGWIAAVTDGTDNRAFDDHSSKAVNAKLYGNVTDDLYLSTSFMNNGPSGESAFEFGGSHVEPVGADGRTSVVGASPSPRVDGTMYQADAVLKFLGRGELALTFGMAEVDDPADAFDRDLRWFMIQPEWQLCDELYVCARYSEIGTYDSDAGYHFDGKTIAGGNGAFGDDVERLQRMSLGVGWRPNLRTLVKGEIGRDRYDVIDASALDTSADRIFFGFQLTISF